jgi:VanZ family protein
MMVIFLGSSDAASFAHSSRLIAPILQWLFPGITPAGLHGVIVTVRKASHFAEYAILAVLTWRCDRKLFASGSAAWPWKSAGRTLMLVVAYAAGDELHQLFVPSREALLVDVLIDSGGGVFALTLIWVLGRWRQRW